MANLADLFDSAAARALDAQASALAGDGGWELMAQAGLAAWQRLLRHWPQALHVGVVVGRGNNGGDGLVLARHALLARHYGVEWEWLDRERMAELIHSERYTEGLFEANALHFDPLAYARGLARGQFFTRQGVLVASTAQEGLIRVAPAAGEGGGE